jgi:hypothetical protein
MDRTHAWYRNPAWRHDFLEGRIRDLSKTGSLLPDEVLVELASILPKEDVVRLYEALRQSKRAESEWRHEFLSIFPSIQESDLPPIVYDQPPVSAEETPEHFRPPRIPLNIESDDDIPF